MRFLTPILAIVMTPLLALAELNCPEDQRESLKAIGEGYLGNREAFTYFRCEFTFTEGMAATVEDGLAGKLTDAVVSRGVWVVDGDTFRYELSCPDEILQKAFDGPKLALESPENRSSKFYGVKLPCDPHGFVTNGKIQLRHGPTIHSANIRSADIPLPGITITPFSVGVMGENDELNPGALLTQGGDGSYAFAWLPASSESDGEAELLTVAFGWGPDEHGPMRRSMQLDPQKGFLPVHCETFFKPEDDLVAQYGARVSILSYPRIRSVSNGRWFPERSIMLEYPDRDQPHRTQIVEVKLLEADQRPAASEFEISIPRGTAVADPSDLRSGFKLQSTRRVGPDDLDDLLAETHGVLKRRIEGEGSPTPIPRPRLQILMWINGVLLLGLAIWFFTERAKKTT